MFPKTVKNFDLSEMVIVSLDLTGGGGGLKRGIKAPDMHKPCKEILML